MSAIQEDEAKKYADLYRFETCGIDFLLSLKHVREGHPEYTHEDVLKPAREMQVFLNQITKELGE